MRWVPTRRMTLSVGPPHLGTLTLSPQGQAALAPPGKATEPFRPHPDAFPRLAVGTLLLELHSVEGTHALRVRNLASPTRASFPGLRYFPDDPAWVIRADWAELALPETTGIGMIGGHSDTVTVTHRALFQIEGHQIALSPTHTKGGKPMFVIRDATSGAETYAAARFLFGEDIARGRITLDFNRAHNPPCAFTDLAICPLPPPGNVLPFAVRAGELAP
jgi:uncharacterized protein